MERHCFASRRWLRTMPSCYAKLAAREPRQLLNCARRNFTFSALAKLDHRLLTPAKLIHLASKRYGYIKGQAALSGIRDSRVLNQQVEAAELLADAFRRIGNRNPGRHVELER